MLKEKLREARKNAKMTQRQVAEAIGVTESTYCGYETGKRQPDPMKISAIASVLGVSGDFLLGINIPENEKKPVSEENGLDDELLRNLMSLTPDEIAKVAAFVQGLLASR